MAHDSIYDLFATDTDAETKGKWLSYGKVKFLVARAGGTNEAFTRAMGKVMRPHARRLKLGVIDAKELNELALVPFVEYCLLGWENVQTKSGEVLSYSKENARKLLTDIPDLYAQLLEDAQAIATFAPEDVEDVAGNL